PLRLSYVIKDEVLKITSEHARDDEAVVLHYNVADLVIALPDFVRTADRGVTSRINEADRQAGRLGAGMGSPMVAAASATGGTTNAVLDPGVLAQMGSSGSFNGFGGPGSPQVSPGPGGLGGGAEPDFDSLIQLITT